MSLHCCVEPFFLSEQQHHEQRTASPGDKYIAFPAVALQVCHLLRWQ